MNTDAWARLSDSTAIIQGYNKINELASDLGAITRVLERIVY